jgi:hypothetical protein
MPVASKVNVISTDPLADSAVNVCSAVTLFPFTISGFFVAYPSEHTFDRVCLTRKQVAV